MRCQNFDGDRAIKARVERSVNFSHAACAQQRLDFVRAEFRARSEGHSGSRNYSVSTTRFRRLPSVTAAWVTFHR